MNHLALLQGEVCYRANSSLIHIPFHSELGRYEQHRKHYRTIVVLLQA
jgi:hypothetical protein